jgi:aryl sulfotransferase
MGGRYGDRRIPSSDVFLSSRAHAENRYEKADLRMLRPVAGALRSYLNEPLNTEAWDDNTLATLVEHYRQTVLSCRLPNLTLLHYADLIFDHGSSVKRLAKAVGVAVDDIQVDRIVAATKLTAMRAEAEKFVPEAGKNFWTNDKDFFGSGGTQKWCGKFLQEDLDLYLTRLAELVPETAPRDWLERGHGYP